MITRIGRVAAGSWSSLKLPKLAKICLREGTLNGVWKYIQFSDHWYFWTLRLESYSSKSKQFRNTKIVPRSEKGLYYLRKSPPTSSNLCVWRTRVQLYIPVVQIYITYSTTRRIGHITAGSRSFPNLPKIRQELAQRRNVELSPKIHPSLQSSILSSSTAFVLYNRHYLCWLIIS